jgi:hypothetical protein
MAPKETKRDKERRLKAQEQEATDAPTNGPTDDDPEEPIQYDTEGVVMRPGTSSAAAAASTAPGASAAAAVAIAKVGSLSLSDSESDGVAREKERSAVVLAAAKRASRSLSSRSRSKVPKKEGKEVKEGSQAAQGVLFFVFLLRTGR